MANYKPDPDPKAGPGWFVSDETQVPRHEFTAANELHLFTFDEDALSRLDCPNECGTYCEPANLGEAVDWALGHKCEPATAGEKE